MTQSECQRVGDLGINLYVMINRSTATSTSGPEQPLGAQTQHYQPQTHLHPTKSAASDMAVSTEDSPFSQSQ